MSRLPERGQSLAEFALVVPIALILMIGLFDAGRAVVAYTSITNAGREGARLAIVNQDVPSISSRVAGQTILVTPTTTVEYRLPGPNADAKDNALCTTLAVGCIARVVVTSNIQMITPLVGQLIGPISLRAESQLPIEFVCPNAKIPGLTTVANCRKQP